MNDNHSYRLRPNMLYPGFPYQELLEEMNARYATTQALKHSFTTTIDDTLGLNVDNYGHLTVLVKKETSVKQIVKVIETVQCIIQAYLPDFKYVFPEELLRQKIYTLLEKNKRMHGTASEPSEDDLALVEQLMHLMSFT